MNVGEKITYYRKKKGYTVNKLANLAGISQSYLRDIEIGKNTNPTVDVLSYICGALDITLQDFFAEESTTVYNEEMLIKEIRDLTPAQQQALLQFFKTIR